VGLGKKKKKGGKRRCQPGPQVAGTQKWPGGAGGVNAASGTYTLTKDTFLLDHIVPRSVE